MNTRTTCRSKKTIMVLRRAPLVYDPEKLIKKYITLTTTNRNGKIKDKRGIVKEGF